MEVLRAGAQSMGLELTSDQEGQFRRYQEGLGQWNRRMSLTSAAALADVESVHFLDSLTLVPLLRRELPEAARLIDVGTGAGFPGVPVKLLVPRLRLTLVEATGKKAEFLRWLVSDLGLEDVEVLAQRAEDIARLPDYRESFDAATARALGSVGTVLELTLPFCAVGGLAVAQRAGDVAGEMAQADTAAQDLGGIVRPLQPVRGLGLRDTAALVVVDKVLPTGVRYPRRAGVPARRPLGVQGVRRG